MKIRKLTLAQCLRNARAFRGDGSIGSVEQFAGIRNRVALWRRASQLTRETATVANGWQPMITCAMARCLRLAGIRAWRSQP